MLYLCSNRVGSDEGNTPSRQEPMKYLPLKSPARSDDRGPIEAIAPLLTPALCLQFLSLFLRCSLGLKASCRAFVPAPRLYRCGGGSKYMTLYKKRDRQQRHLSGMVGWSLIIAGADPERSTDDGQRPKGTDGRQLSQRRRERPCEASQRYPSRLPTHVRLETEDFSAWVRTCIKTVILAASASC